MASAFPLGTVERLVGRIIAGEAVFFVGAGFSLDSEPNTSPRLIRRLMARFAAITEELAETPGSAAPQMREGLRVTFGLGDTPLSSAAMIADATVKQLSQVYYNINDWVCSAFTILLRELRGAEASAVARIREQEAGLLATTVGGAPSDDVPLAGIDVAKLLELGNDAGKGLFLETMGFADGRIWGGAPREHDPGAAVVSYGGRLLDRQFVIARLAREGLTPLILTTNFDLLLEGACRAVGFEVGDVRHTDPAKPAAAYDRLLVVAGPTEFFERGTAYRAALLLKIHGCVYRYRMARLTPATLARYLPSMVFTYREIQNWRKDSWSRDLVSTLLRTRSILLCGYSGGDPVVHDTFRTVYEEIQANRPRTPADAVAVPSGAVADDTRVFFTGAAGKGEFAGLEILRAGSRAAGVDDPPLFDHPNYLPFHFPAKAGHEQGFPTLDELFLWIYHRSLRRLQLNAIRSDLGRIAVMLLHRNVAPGDVDDIASAFEALCLDETRRAAQWDGTERSRLEFRPITAWTNDFHVALLREFALMETVARNQRSGLRIQEFRSPTYYFALLDRPGWGAWGVVVELALRRMAALAGSGGADVTRSPYPVALVTPGRGTFTRTAIVLRGPAVQGGTRADLLGLYRRVHEWHLMTWLTGESPPAGTPTADDVWRWAFLPAADLEPAPPSAWFGESDDFTSQGLSEAARGPDRGALRAEVAGAKESHL